MWHFAVFSLANVAMFALNEIYTPTVRWFVWPLAGWGVALAFHAFATSSAGNLSEDMIRHEIEKEKQRRGLA
jgi:hypothetical protein